MKFKLIYVLFLLIPFNVSSQADSIQSTTIRVGVKNTPPFIIKTGESYSGISIELWERIAEEKNIDFEYREYLLDELLEKLNNNEVDICINPLTVTSNRLKNFDFTQPFYTSSLAIAVRRDDSTFFSNFFSRGLLKVIALMLMIIFLFGLLMWLAEKSHYPESHKKGFPGFFRGWMRSSTLIMSSKKSKSVHTGTGSFLSIIGALIVIFIICGYAAASFFQLNIDKNAQNASDLNALKNIKVASISTSAPNQFLLNHGIEPKEYDNMEKLINALIKKEVQAIVYDEPILRYEIHLMKASDEIQILPHHFNEQYYGFSAPKNSRLLQEINPVLFEIFEGDDWEQILMKYNLNP